MQCLVVGHSGTAGYGLPSAEEAWPSILQRLLNRDGAEDWSVSPVPLHPVGNKAVGYAASRVAAFSPDVVILSLNTYPCCVPIVSASIRRRFGARAERAYRALESRFERSVASNRPNAFGRRMARRAFGARPLASVEEVTAVYTGILRNLARLERVEVLVLAEAPFSSEVQRRVPNLTARVGGMFRELRAIADEHRFTWCDAASWVASEGDAAWQSDGVHLSPTGNLRYAEHLAVALRALAAGIR